MNIYRNTLFQIGAAAALILSLNACSKEAKPDNNPGVLDYYNFISQPSNGVFGIKSYSTLATQDHSRITYTGGAFVDADNHSLPGGTVSIGNISLVDSVVSGGHSYGMNTNQGTELFGTNTTFNINPNPDNAITGKNASVTMYAPALISIDTKSIGDNIQPHSVIAWNADAQNPQNVMIVIEYDPTFAENGSAALKYPDKLTTSLAVPDNGSYRFTNGDLGLFPPAATLTVQLKRLNYAKAVSTDGTASYLVYSSNMVDAMFFHP
jgi:hypothetical protein